MSSYKSVFLKKGKERAILNRHPWLFSGAIKEAALVNVGDVVLVKDCEGNPLAIGHWCGNEGLVCRLLTFNIHEQIDDKFFNNIIHNAIKLRQKFYLPNKTTNGYRLIHGEGDGLSGLVCDIYDTTACVQITNHGLMSAIPLLCDILNKEISIKNIYIKEVFNGSARWLVGKADNAIFLENNLSFVALVKSGQKTGHFLDQRDNRAFLKTLAKEKKVLDAFAYGGGFSLYALAGGASYVTTVDIAKDALALAKENLQLNGLLANHEAILGDCFLFLRQMKSDFYDIIVLDPPAFAKEAKATAKASRGYKDINLLAMRNIKKGGIVLTFSCSQHISEDLFQKIIFSAAKDANRQVKIIKKLGQGIDHPVSLYCPQSSYLKGLALYVE